MPIELLAHQKTAVSLAKKRDFFALFMEMGTGKTFCAFDIMEYWHFERGAKRIIVIAPNSLRGNWIVEAEKYGFFLKIKSLPDTGGAEARRKLIADPSWQVLVINYEALRNLSNEIIAAQPDGLVLDELHRCKGRKSIQTRMAREISMVVKKNGGSRLGLTGTPIVHEPTDLWAEFDVLMPSPGSSNTNHPLKLGGYYQYERSIAVVTPHFRLGMRAPQRSFPIERIEMLRQRLAPHVFEISKDQCLDLPERTFKTIRIAAGAEQMRVYTALKEEYIAWLDAGAPPIDSPSPRGEEVLQTELKFTAEEPDFSDPSNQITVTMATTLLIRLQQITSGFIKTDDGVEREIPNAKIDVLRDLLPHWIATEGDHKAVIFCCFKHDIETLSKLCEELKVGYVTLSGKNSKQASELVDKFQNDPDTRVFIGNLVVSSVGLTLTAADYCCYYSNSFKLEHRMQSQDRVHRYGQKRKVTYYDLALDKTTDLQVLRRLTEKKNLANLTIKDLREMLR